MANNCYNLFQFLGNAKVKKQIATWKEQLDLIKPTDTDPDCMRAIRDVFYPDVPDNEVIDYGCDFVYADEECLSPEGDEIAIVSAWTPPNALQERLACLLHPLDKRVVVRNQFNAEDGTQGVAYAAAYDPHHSYIQETSVVVDSDEEDSELAENEAQEQLREQELEILDYFMDDMEGTVKTIKKHMPDLDIDWSNYN